MLKPILPCTPSGNMLVLQVGTLQPPLPPLPSLEGASRFSLCRCPHRFRQRLVLGQRSLEDLVIAWGPREQQIQEQESRKLISVLVLCQKTQRLEGGGGLLRISLIFEEHVRFYKALSHMLFHSILNLLGPRFPHVKMRELNQQMASRLSSSRANIF